MPRPCQLPALPDPHAPTPALKRWMLLAQLLASVWFSSSCTQHHSRQALWAGVQPTPTNSATFVSEEDAGLALFGLIQITEPDHYAVLLERARQRFKCRRFSNAQLDFYTDHWLVIAFPIARVTLICEHDLSAQPAAPRGVSSGPDATGPARSAAAETRTATTVEVPATP